MTFEEIQALFEKQTAENGLDICLSYADMPQGYEMAYGTYDPVLKTLFLNPTIAAPVWEQVFYLFHELRHAMQYAHPDDYPQAIRDSLPYVILYDGTCFRLKEDKWAQCTLEGDRAYFTLAYQNLPYEVDAYQYAFEQTMRIMPEEEQELRALLDFWLPKETFDEQEYVRIFKKIDQLTQ